MYLSGMQAFIWIKKRAQRSVAGQETHSPCTCALMQDFIRHASCHSRALCCTWHMLQAGCAMHPERVSSAETGSTHSASSSPGHVSAGASASMNLPLQAAAAGPHCCSISNTTQSVGQAARPAASQQPASLQLLEAATAAEMAAAAIAYARDPAAAPAASSFARQAPSWGQAARQFTQPQWPGCAAAGSMQGPGQRNTLQHRASTDGNSGGSGSAGNATKRGPRKKQEGGR